MARLISGRIESRVKNFTDSIVIELEHVRKQWYCFPHYHGKTISPGTSIFQEILTVSLAVRFYLEHRVNSTFETNKHF